MIFAVLYISVDLKGKYDVYFSVSGEACLAECEIVLQILQCLKFCIRRSALINLLPEFREEI